MPPEILLAIDIVELLVQAALKVYVLAVLRFDLYDVEFAIIFKILLQNFFHRTYFFIIW